LPFGLLTVTQTSKQELWMAGMANNTTTYYAVYFLIAATFVCKGSHNGQAIRNDGFFFVYH